MKKVQLIAIAFFSVWILSAAAQPGGGPPPGEKKEQIEAMKVAFLTRKLDLTPQRLRISGLFTTSFRMRSKTFGRHIGKQENRLRMILMKWPIKMWKS
jgi:hypothetical protein